MSREKISRPGNILEMHNIRYNHCLRYTTIQIGMRHDLCGACGQCISKLVSGPDMSKSALFLNILPSIIFLFAHPLLSKVHAHLEYCARL